MEAKKTRKAWGIEARWGDRVSMRRLSWYDLFLYASTIIIGVFELLMSFEYKWSDGICLIHYFGVVVGVMISVIRSWHWWWWWKWNVSTKHVSVTTDGASLWDMLRLFVIIILIIALRAHICLIDVFLLNVTAFQQLQQRLWNKWKCSLLYKIWSSHR